MTSDLSLQGIIPVEQLPPKLDFGQLRAQIDRKSEGFGSFAVESGIMAK